MAMANMKYELAIKDKSLVEFNTQCGEETINLL